MTYIGLLSYFVLLIPYFGKAINYSESVILYGGTIILAIFSFFYPSPRRLNKKFIGLEIILVLLSFLSTLFSKNIGYSYYALFNFIFSLVILDLCLKYLDTEKLSSNLLYFSLIYSTIFLLNKLHFITLIPDSSFDDFIIQVWGHSYVADFLILSIPYLIYHFLYKKFSSISQKRFYIFSLIYIFLILIFSHSRSAIVAISVSSIYIVLPKIKKYLRLPFVILILGLSLFYNYQILAQNRIQKSPDGNRLEYWQEAITAFIAKPLLGHGPGNFFYINKQYQNIPFTNTNYAHNSLLEYLCLNGLLFTLLIFYLIFTSLYYQFQNHRLNFSIGLTTLINSFLDPSWNSIGIFCLSMFFILSQDPNIVTPSPPKRSWSDHLPNILIILIILFFFISKTTSDYLYINHQFDRSLQADRFNLNPRLADIDKNISSTLKLFQNDSGVYKTIISESDQIDGNNEGYYLKLIEIDPKENIKEYLKLAEYYFSSKNYQKLKHLLGLADQHLDANRYTDSEILPLAKISYKLALIYWENNHLSDAIIYFKTAVNFSHGWSHFQIELANAYWHNDQIYLAKKQLEIECPKFQNSIKHCQQYLSEHSKLFLTPGTNGFQKAIDDI